MSDRVLSQPSSATKSNKGHSKSSASKKKTVEDETKLIRVILIVDTITGITLYEKVYRWDEKSNIGSLGSLVQSLYQLAREIDDGEIESVSFTSNQSRSSKREPIAPNPRFRQLDESKGTNSTTERMKMLCSRGEDITASLFYDYDPNQSVTATKLTDKMQNFIASIHEAFLHSANHLFILKRTKLSELACSTGTDTSEELRTLRMEFESLFNDRLAELQNEFFSATHSTQGADGSQHSGGP